MKALNSLLAKGSKQKIQIGDATTVFWSEKNSYFEGEFLAFLNDPPKDNPDYLTEKVKALYQSINTGVLLPEDQENRFFVLGLAPNASRIAIRFWHTGSIAEFSQRFAQHFHDLEINSNKSQHLSLNQLLRSTAAQRKSENIAANMAGSCALHFIWIALSRFCISSSVTKNPC